jgi:integrase/recombinase XerD
VLIYSTSSNTLFLGVEGGQIPLGTMSVLVRKYVEKSGVGKPGSCHLFRHTKATLMHENGANIRLLQEMLGHAELSTTEIYTQVSIHRLKKVHSATHPAENEKEILAENSKEKSP